MYERSEIVSADKAKTDLIVPRSIFGSWLRTGEPLAVSGGGGGGGVTELRADLDALPLASALLGLD